MQAACLARSPSPLPRAVSGVPLRVFSVRPQLEDLNREATRRLLMILKIHLLTLDRSTTLILHCCPVGGKRPIQSAWNSSSLLFRVPRTQKDYAISLPF